MQRTPGQALLAHHTRFAGRSSGFTLLELMVTVVVLAIVLAIAGPSFSNVINRNRLVAGANEFVAAMQTARVEAIRRNSRGVLCPSTDGAACAGSDWSRLIVFVDANGNSEAGDDGDLIIRDVQVSSAGLSIKASTNTATNNRIRFGSDGLAWVGNASAREGGLSVCSTKLPAADNTRDVVVGVSRIGVEPRNGSSTCTARSD